MDRQVGISHAGSRLLRKYLVQASWIGQQYNPWMKETFERVCAGKKERKKKAIVAVARQLFVRLWAMDRDGKTWNGPAATQPAKRSTRPPVESAETAPAATRNRGGRRRVEGPQRVEGRQRAEGRWGSAPNPAS
jgi:hypothetical protein